VFYLKKTTKKSIKTPSFSEDKDNSESPAIESSMKDDADKPADSKKEIKDDVVESLFIEPVGYPIRMIGSEQSTDILVDDTDLFEKYCVDQWAMMHVDVGTYLFDQYLFPDFAFKVTGVSPGPGIINSETHIIMSRIRPKYANKIRPVKIEDVIGQDLAKRKTAIILEYLKDPDKFGDYWAPKNILFHGPPGTGKTMLARALATKVKVNFLSSNGTSLIGVHVGDGAKKIHELYEMAESMAPVIVFIDELDAIGLSRSFQHVRGDVIEVANALLSELDGINDKKGIVTIACTNQIRLLDPALRSRFEEEIEFKLPSVEDRVKIIRLYAGKSPIKMNLNYLSIAKKLEGWSGRDIKEKLIKNLIHQAILDGKKEITTEMALEYIKNIKDRVVGEYPSTFSI